MSIDPNLNENLITDSLNVNKSESVLVQNVQYSINQDMEHFSIEDMEDQSCKRSSSI